MQPSGWKLPFNIALGIHLLVVLAALYLPGLFDAKPKFADIQTVSLINIAEPSPAPPAPPAAKPQPPAPAKAQEAAPPPPPPAIKKAVPVPEPAPEKPEPAPSAPPKAISLKPLKQKVVKEVKEPEPEPPPAPRKKEEDLKKVQKLAEALREEAILAERARLAQEALEVERKVLAQSSKGRMVAPAVESAPSGSSAPSGAAVAGSSNNLLESQYQAAIASRLQQFWSLPEYLQKDPELTAVVAITIRVDGTIANVVFENRSGDRIFDQFVSKAIEDATPLPPIPPALKKQRYEIGFRFKPGGIQ